MVRLAFFKIDKNKEVLNMQIPKFEQGHVLIVGDIMLDKYMMGSTARISPEAPVPVVHVKDEDERPGGAGNVAFNVSTLGARTILLGLIGDDKNGETLQNKLTQMQIEHRLNVSKRTPTITKLRILSRHQQLIRLDFEDKYASSDSMLLHDDFMACIQDKPLVILSDYSKGTIDDPQFYIQAARLNGCKIIVDPKSRDFSIYRGAHLLTPNRKEFEAAVGPCENDEDIAQKGQALMHQFKFDALLITRGEQGMTLLQKDKSPLHLRTHAQEVYDVTGAGDTVIGTIGAALSTHGDLENAVRLANLAAGISVNKLGASSVSIGELKSALLYHTLNTQSIVSEVNHLLELVNTAKDNGETVVFTNGCFDILHPGHISYLQEAKKLGDYLIVAINSDDSVKRLKGASRPYNHCKARMEVLAALSCVDWVIAFDEDTPLTLIEKLSPHILVKGGDYPDPKLIVGSEQVIASGGEVHILPFKDGYSTTRLIQRIIEEGETS